MIRHIVMWKFADESYGLTRAENMAEITRRLYALRDSGKIAGLLRMEIGQDVGHTDMSYDMVLLTEFSDRDALAAYKVYPDHRAISEYVRGVRTARAVVDCEI